MAVPTSSAAVRDNIHVRWGSPFTWITIAALLAAVFCQLLGWEVVRTVIVIAWAVVLLLVVMTRGMRWTSFLTYLSTASLLAAVISQLAGYPSVRAWLLLAWAVLLLPVAVSLFSHPMRGPAWGLFIGFWGVVGALWLIVIQILAVAGVLSGQSYRGGAAWPLALAGIWLITSASLGFGAERFPRWVDALGVLAGAGLFAIAVTAWSGVSDDSIRAVEVFAAITYCLWALSLGRVLWGAQDVSHRFRGLSIEPA